VAEETFEHGASFVLATLTCKTRDEETVELPVSSMIDCNCQLSTFKVQEL
jgi:hypothetical protein